LGLWSDFLQGAGVDFALGTEYNKGYRSALVEETVMTETIIETPTGIGKPSRWVVELAQLWSPQGQWTKEEYLSLPHTNRFELDVSDVVGQN
jgi:hypothetical protein